MKGGRRLLLSRRQEKKGMERLGGVRNPRSGGRWDRRNDGRTDDELVEFKRTDNRAGITLRWADLDALHQHALAEHRTPVLCFELNGVNFAVLRELDYLLLRRPEPGDPRDLRARQRDQLDEPGEVLGDVRERRHQPVLRRAPTQQLSGAGGQERVPGNPPGPPRSVPGPRAVSRLRNRERRAVGSLGRVQRKGAAANQASEAP